jgi:hypothetical protein
MHIHLSGMGMQGAYGAGNGERAAAAERAAETRKKLLKAGQNAGATGAGAVADADEDASLMIGQWTDSRHSEVMPAAQYHDAAEGDDPDFA